MPPAVTPVTPIKLYFAPRTRSVRILWLLEELGLPYVLQHVDFRPTSTEFFVQQTPTGKLPTIEDGRVVMAESGAIVEYLLERYAEGRLAPPVGTAERADYLQWFHFAESTAFPPLGIVVWLTMYRTDAADHAAIVDDARARSDAVVQQIEQVLSQRSHIAGEAFSAADIMLGFTLWAARLLGILDKRFPHTLSYLARMEARPAFAKALAAD